MVIGRFLLPLPLGSLLGVKERVLKVFYERLYIVVRI
jgi:hypothetical protein